MDKNIGKKGRMNGGCAILWKPHIKWKMSLINCNHKTMWDPHEQSNDSDS